MQENNINKDKPLKVLILGPAVQDPGGVANYYNAVLQHFPIASTTIEYLEIGSTKAGKNPFYLLTDQFRLWRRISEIRPDIVHVNPSLDAKSFLRDAIFLLATRLRRVRRVVFFRGWTVSFEDTIRRYLLPLFRATFAKADGVVVLGSYFAQRLQEWGLRTPIYFGTTAVPDDLLSGFSISDKIDSFKPNERIKLLFLARLEKNKGVVELVKAVADLVESGVPVSLTIAGKGGAEQAIQDELTKRPKVCEHIKMIGYVRGEQKTRVFNEHHVFCFPTQHGEGMPNALLEAMAFGLNVITCPVGGIGDFFEDPKMGRLIESADPALIRTALIDITQDPQKMTEVAQYNHDYAKEHFLASKAAQFLERTYRSVAGANSQSTD